MYVENIENDLSGLAGRFSKLRKRIQTPLKKTVAVVKRVQAPALKVTKKAVKRAVKVHEKMPITKWQIKHQAKVGKVVRPVAKVVSFVPGWIGGVAGGLIALDKVSAARRAKKLRERQNATSEAEIARIDAEIKAIEESGTPIDQSTKIPPVEAPLTANASIGAQTAFTNAGGGYIAPGDSAEPGEEAKPVEKKPVPWGLIGAGVLTALTIL